MRVHCIAVAALSLTFSAADTVDAAGDIVPLGPEFIVAANTTYEQKQPWVASDDDGAFVVCYSWLKDVYFRRYDRDGQPLGTEQLVNPTLTYGEQDESYIAMDPVNGDFVIGWSDRHGNDGFLMGCGARFYRFDGVPYSDEQIINVHTDQSQFEPYFAYLPSGTVMAAWTDAAAGADGVASVGRMFDRYGNPIAGEFLVNEPNNKTQIDAALACARLTNMFVAAYVDASGATGEPREVLGRRFDQNGSPIGSAFLVNTVSVGMQREPIVAMNAHGDFVIAWHDESGQDGSGFGVYARSYRSDGMPAGPQFLVNVVTDGDQRDPHVAMDYAGNFVVTWEDNSSGDYDVKVRRYDRHANPISGEIIVHDGLSGNQVYAKSSLSQSGQRLVCVWYDDKEQDAYARVFSIPVISATSVVVGSTATLDIDLPGMAGESYVVLPSLGTDAGIPVSGQRTLRLNPDPLFQAGAAFPNGPAFFGLSGVLDGAGKAVASVQLPADPALSGFTFYLAAVTLGEWAVEVVTDPLELTIQ